MDEVKKQNEAVPATPDFKAWTKLMAAKLGETPTPEREETISLTLEWMHDPDAAAKKFDATKKQKVVDLVKAISSSEGQKADLKLLATDESLDPALKKALDELLAHVEGTKNTLEAPPDQPAGGVPIDAASDKPAETAPSGEDSPEAPAGTDTPAAAQPQGDGAPAQEAADAKKDKDARETVESLQNLQQEAKTMSTGTLLAELFKMIKNLFEKFGQGLNPTTTPPKLTEDQVKQVKLDFSKVDESKSFTASNKDVEYVATVLNLPVMQDAAAFLNSLKNTPNCVFNAAKEISKLKTGDVLFFHDGKDKEKAVTTAIVSNTEPPPKMKLVHDGDKVQEVIIEQSTLTNNWLGYVRMPESAPAQPAAPPPAQPAAPSPTQPVATPPAQPVATPPSKPASQPPATPPAQPAL